MIVVGLLFAAVAGRTWRFARRNGSWKSLLGGSAVAILAYCGFIAWTAGPGAKVLDQLSAGALFGILAVVSLTVLLGLCELAFQWLDGPSPELSRGVVPVNIYRRRLYPWMAIAALTVILMAGAVFISPPSWRDNLFLATWLVGIFSCIALWFSHYRARRFDFGRTALQSNPWVHWVYAVREKGIEPGAPSETWIGPDGLLFAGQFAPWSLFTCQLVRAVANTDSPLSLDFTFEKTTFGNATSQDVYRVPIPEGHSSDLEAIDQKLRALCPRAVIQLLP